jgi:hypothetical protein
MKGEKWDYDEFIEGMEKYRASQNPDQPKAIK